jgi:hypothetical protein
MKITVSVDAAGALGDVTVADAPDAGARACVVAAVRRLKVRQPPVALVASRWAIATVVETAFGLTLVEPGRAPRPLVTDVRFPGGLRNVRLDGRRVLVDLEEGRPEQAYQVGHDGSLTRAGEPDPPRSRPRR